MSGNQLKEHKSNKVKHTEKWHFDKNNINVDVVEKEMSQSEASAEAHRLEDDYTYEDYEIINTRGI